jgi:hypothetical protein
MAGCLVVFLVALFFIFQLPQRPHALPQCPPSDRFCEVAATGNLQPPSNLPEVVAVISAIGTVVSAICTVTTLFLAWRKDRREAIDLKLRVAELERAAKQRQSFDS